jgi:probable F420-dependent oxidoreductase
MKIGLLMLATAQAAEVGAVAQKAEALGFDSFWLPEHPVIPVHYKSRFPYTEDGVIPDLYAQFVDPFVGLSFAAAVTKTIKLGTAICLVPERDPLVTAKAVATLDHYSQGRFLFGIGAGWLPEETEIMGAQFATRWAQTKESVLAMKALWTTGQAEYRGTHINFPAVKVFPQPRQKPHPPVLIGANGEAALKRSVAWGEGWLPFNLSPEELKSGMAKLRRLAQEAGRNPDSLEVTLSWIGDAADLDTVKRLQDTGLHRLICALPVNEAPGFGPVLEKLASQTIQKLG